MTMEIAAEKESPAGAQRVVILVHGIRTFGEWQSRLSELLVKEDSSVQCLTYFYGYLSPIYFWIPFLRVFARRGLYNWLNDNEKFLHGKQLTIVAHSFGTHIVAYLLKAIHRSCSVKFCQVIFCGSVVRDTFMWDKLVGPQNCVRTLYNFCGTRDIWPIMAQLLVLNTGLGGRYGFRGVLGVQTGIVNLYHAVDHSGFFEESFMVANWLPIILGRDLSSILRAVRPPTPSWLTDFAVVAEPIKLALLFLPIVVPTWIVWEAHQEGIRLRNKADFEEGLQRLTAVALTWREGPEQTFAELVSKDAPTGLTFLHTKLQAELLNSIISSLTADEGDAFKSGTREILWSPNRRFALLIFRSQSVPETAAAPSLYLFDSARSTISKMDYPGHFAAGATLSYGFEEANNKPFVMSGSELRVFEADGKRFQSFSTTCPTSGIESMALLTRPPTVIFRYASSEICIVAAGKDGPPTTLRLSSGSDHVVRFGIGRGKSLVAVTMSSGDAFLLTRSDAGWSSSRITSSRKIYDVAVLGDGRIGAIVEYRSADYPALDQIGQIRCRGVEAPVSTRFVLLDESLSVASAKTVQCVDGSAYGVLRFFGKESSGLALYAMKDQPFQIDLRVDVFSDVPTEGIPRHHSITSYSNELISRLSEGSLSEVFRRKGLSVVE
jgi:hypothetical protein